MSSRGKQSSIGCGLGFAGLILPIVAFIFLANDPNSYRNPGGAIGTWQFFVALGILAGVIGIIMYASDGVDD